MDLTSSRDEGRVLSRACVVRADEKSLRCAQNPSRQKAVNGGGLYEFLQNWRSLATYWNRFAALPSRCNVRKVLRSKCCQRSFEAGPVVGELSRLRCRPGWSAGGLQRDHRVDRVRVLGGHALCNRDLEFSSSGIPVAANGLAST